MGNFVLSASEVCYCLCPSCGVRLEHRGEKKRPNGDVFYYQSCPSCCKSYVSSVESGKIKHKEV